MNMSSMIKQYDLQFVEVIRDVDFKTLSLAGAELELSALTFVEDKKYLENLTKSQKMIITNKETATFVDEGLGLCITDNPRILFFSIHNLLANDKEYIREIYETKVGNNCKISDMAHISKNNVTIGDNVIIEEFVSIKENVIIGDNSIIRAGTIIGGEGFEFKRNKSNMMGIRHLGGVEIGMNVEIQHNACIDKALYPWDDTIIENDVAIDNLVYIAHGVKIKSGSMVVALSGVGGRVEIGESSWIGLGSTIRNGIKIGDNARVNMGAVVTQNVVNNEAVSGNFAIEHSKFLDNLKKNR